MYTVALPQLISCNSYSNTWKSAMFNLLVRVMKNEPFFIPTRECEKKKRKKIRTSNIRNFVHEGLIKASGIDKDNISIPPIFTIHIQNITVPHLQYYGGGGEEEVKTQRQDREEDKHVSIGRFKADLP